MKVFVLPVQGWIRYKGEYANLVLSEGVNVTTEEITQAYAGYAKQRHWHVSSLKILQTQAADLLMELYGITQAHDIGRSKLGDDGQPYRDKDGHIKLTSLRGFRGVRLRRKDEEDPEQ